MAIKLWVDRLTGDEHLDVSPDRAPDLEFIPVDDSPSLPIHLLHQLLLCLMSCNFSLKNVTQRALAWIDVSALSKGCAGDVVRFALDRDGENLAPTRIIILTQPSSCVSSSNPPLSSVSAAMVTSEVVSSFDDVNSVVQRLTDILDLPK